MILLKQFVAEDCLTKGLLIYIISHFLFFITIYREMTKITNSSPIGNTNQRTGVHGPLNISEVGSGAMEIANFHSQICIPEFQFRMNQEVEILN
jgi:hypothetical protein